MERDIHNEQALMLKLAFQNKIILLVTELLLPLLTYQRDYHAQHSGPWVPLLLRSTLPL